MEKTILYEYGPWFIEHKRYRASKLGVLKKPAWRRSYSTANLKYLLCKLKGSTVQQNASLHLVQFKIWQRNFTKNDNLVQIMIDFDQFWPDFGIFPIKFDLFLIKNLIYFWLKCRLKDQNYQNHQKWSKFIIFWSILTIFECFWL